MIVVCSDDCPGDQGDHKDRPYGEGSKRLYVGGLSSDYGHEIMDDMIHYPQKHHRRSMRLKGYDYSRVGAYFVTICVQNGECLFGRIENGQMRLNGAGRMVQAAWNRLPQRFPHTIQDAFVVMPNHVHAILILTDDRRGDQGDHKDRPYEVKTDDRRGESCIRPHPDHVITGGQRLRGTAPGSLGRIVQAFKSITTHEYVLGVKRRDWPPFPGKLWQRNYYEHVVRDDDDLDRIRQYIGDNPACWIDDENHPANIPSP